MINANAGNKPVRPPSTHQPSFRSPAEARKRSVPAQEYLTDLVQPLLRSFRTKSSSWLLRTAPVLLPSSIMKLPLPTNSQTVLPWTRRRLQIRQLHPRLVSESSMGWPSLVEVILAVINIGRRHPSVEQFSTTGSSLADSPVPKTDQRRHQGEITW